MEHFFLAALQSVRGLGSVSLRKLHDRFGSWEEAWRSGAPGLADKVAEAALKELIKLRRQESSLPEHIADICQQRHIHVCMESEADYPEALRQIFNPPLLLFYRGSLQPEARRIAVVGSRHCSPYGTSAAELLSAGLASEGITIVSGAARGIDTAAHKGALSQGRTVAVLGCGVDVVYPAENRNILESIAEKGAVLSEYLPGTQPLPGFFPARNRIISGLSSGVLVIEAAARSGALITAEMALSENRDVFAVPGSIYSASSCGTNKLLQQGAKLVMSPADVLSEYGWQQAPAAVPEEKLDLSPAESEIYKILSLDKPLSVDEIIYSLHGRGTADTAFLLLQLELKGLIAENAAHGYVRTAKGGIL